nr:NinE family protein [Escherichia coli]
MSNHIFKVPARSKRKPGAKPSDIPTFNYSAHLYDVRWLRLRARRKSA